MRKPLIAVLMTSAFFSSYAHAADLIQVYQQALANDAQYASARAALSAGMERVPQGLAGLLPQVSASGSNTRNNIEPISSTITMPTVKVHTNSYNLTLAQPLFRWDRWETYQQSKLAQAIAEAQFAQVQQDLITRVAQAYFDVLSAQDNLGATQAQKVDTTEQLASAKRNFEVGTQTITDTHEAQAAYDLVVAQEFAAINDLANKRSALQTIIGEAPASLAPMRTGVLLSAPEPAAIEPWVSSAEEQNYSVVTAQFNVESAKRDIGRNRAGHYPTLDLIANAGHSYSSGGGNGNGNNNNAIGVQWSIP